MKKTLLILTLIGMILAVPAMAEVTRIGWLYRVEYTGETPETLTYDYSPFTDYILNESNLNLYFWDMEDRRFFPMTNTELDTDNDEINVTTAYYNNTKYITLGEVTDACDGVDNDGDGVIDEGHCSDIESTVVYDYNYRATLGYCPSDNSPVLFVEFNNQTGDPVTDATCYLSINDIDNGWDISNEKMDFDDQEDFRYELDVASFGLTCDSPVPGQETWYMVCGTDRESVTQYDDFSGEDPILMENGGGNGGGSAVPEFNVVGLVVLLVIVALSFVVIARRKQ